MDTKTKRYYGEAEHEKDFNIGTFVSSYDFLKGQLDEFHSILQTADSLRRWEVPPVTLLCCVFVITICISFPELLLAFFLFPIPFALLVTGIKAIAAQSEKKPVKHIVVMAIENDEEKLKRKEEAIAKSTKDLRRFVKILCELQYWIKEVSEKLKYLQRIFSWGDPHLTLSLVPLSLMTLILFLVVFFNNEAFKLVLVKYLTMLKVYVPESDLIGPKIQEKNDDEWFDAYAEDESDNSSYEDDSNESDFEDISFPCDNSVKQRRPGSLVSHISRYRKLRQELNKGNCAACQVAFSSLLTRRRYCRRCGDKFCSKCCRHKVKKAALGATAPGSRDKRVVVCNDCYAKLRVTKAPD